MAKTQAVAAVESNVPAVAENDNDVLFDSASMGMQGVGAEDMAIPFISLIQSGSPQRKKSDGKYIQGAEEGMVFNTVTNELFEMEKDGITVVPCAFERKMIQWRPRDEGGGIVGIHEAHDPIVKTARKEGSKDVLPDGSILVNTAQHYCLFTYPDGTFKRVVISMSSTQLKKSRRWLTMMGEKVMKTSDGRIFTPPTFAFKYKLTSQPEENKDGSWYGWRIEEVGRLDHSGEERDLFKAAKEFSEAVLKGTVQVQQPVDDSPDNLDNDIPF